MSVQAIGIRIEYHSAGQTVLKNKLEEIGAERVRFFPMHPKPTANADVASPGQIEALIKAGYAVFKGRLTSCELSG